MSHAVAVRSLLTAVLVAGLPWLSVAPVAAAAGRCEEGTGVTVVVDPGSLGGGTRVGCAPDGADQAGSVVVPAAGFPLVYVSGEPFVCRVAGAPSAAAEDCADTPPADAYWGLFWSDGDPARWSYATVGITGLEVPEGGSIGWRWQDGGGRELPSAAPNAAPPTDGPSDGPSDGPKDESKDGPGTGPDKGPGNGAGGPAGGGTGGHAGDRTGEDRPGPDTSDGSRGGSDTGADTGGTGAAPGAASPRDSVRSPSSAPSASAAPRRPAGSARTGTPARDTAGPSTGERSPEGPGAGVDGPGIRRDGTTTRALEPAAGTVPTDGERDSVLPWVAGGVLLALAAGAAALGRRRSAGA